jgi:hypothetical protein
MRLKLKQTMAKEVIATTEHDDKTTHLEKQKKTAAFRMPPSKGGSKLPLAVWGPTKTNSKVLVIFAGLEKGIDRKELAHAVEAMKASLNNCSLWEGKES